MLVLSRKQNESIVIGDNVQIEVLKVSGSTVRIGIKAPRDVKVLRGELAPYGLRSEERDRADSSEVDSENDEVSFTVTLPIQSEQSTGLANPFVAGTANVR